MGKYDDAMYSYLSDNGRFADLFNGAVFCGETVLQADALEESAERYVQMGAVLGQTWMTGDQGTGNALNSNGHSKKTKRKATKAQNRYRDIKKHLKEGGRILRGGDRGSGRHRLHDAMADHDV